MMEAGSSTCLSSSSHISAPATRLSTAQFHESVLGQEPQSAVFDCDGTLWNGDAGYDFMLWSIERGLVSRNTSDWIDSRYRLYRAGEVSEISICGEMVQMYAGLEESELRRAAAEFFRTRVERHIFPAMLELVHTLRSRGTEIWAVSSTNNWVIEEGVQRFGIMADRILCARVEIHHNRVSSTLIDVPTDEGKAAALDSAGLSRPDAVFGNSIHDAAMMAIAAHAYPVNPTPALVAIAEERRWPLYYPAV